MNHLGPWYETVAPENKYQWQGAECRLRDQPLRVRGAVVRPGGGEVYGGGPDRGGVSAFVGL